MAMDQVLKVIFQGDSRGLSSSLRSLQGEFKNFGATASRAFGGLQSAFAALGVTLSAGAFTLGMKKIIDGIDALNDSTQQLGLSSEALSELGYAAEQSGMSLEDLQTGLKFLNKNLAEAQQGNKKLAASFYDLGVNAVDDTETALAKLADAFAAMPDGMRKTNAALEIFGKSGIKLIPFLNNGSAGLATLREEAQRLGISIGGDTVKAADEFNDRLNTLGNAVKGMGVAIAKDALPGLVQISTAMANAATSGGGLSGVLAALGREIQSLMRYGSGTADRKKGLLGELAVAEKELQERIRRREELLKEYEAAPIGGYFGNKKVIGEKLDNVTTNIMKTEEEVQRLNKELLALTAAETAAAGGAKTLAEDIQRVGPMAKMTGDEIAALSGSYAKLIKDIKDAKKDAFASPLKDVKDSSVITINRLKDDAQKLIEGGDAEGAERLIKQAAAINNYLLENKQISKTYYQTQADAILQLAEQGQAVIDSGKGLTLPVAPDLETAEKSGMLAWDTAQAAITAKGPVVIPGVVQIGAGAFADEAGATTDGRVNISAAGIFGRASGGLINGPGTSVSDSILARLSAGEYVVKAAAVKNYGLGFLERLNSMSLPRFAAGGPVGTPINIHLDGHSYPMQAQPSVAKALGRILGTEVLKRGRR